MAMMELMERFGLSSHIDKQTRHYSSGMLQRLRLVMCLANGPDIILLDEPGDNLDDDGRERLYSFLESVKPDKIIIIATNSSHEAGLCGTGVRLGL
jgi:ABC-type multidrug transport system ATPase subunit